MLSNLCIFPYRRISVSRRQAAPGHGTGRHPEHAAAARGWRLRLVLRGIANCRPWSALGYVQHFPLFSLDLLGRRRFDFAARSSSCPLPRYSRLPGCDQCPSSVRTFEERLAGGGSTARPYGRIQLHTCSYDRCRDCLRKPDFVLRAAATGSQKSGPACRVHILRQYSGEFGDAAVGISQPCTRLSLSRAEPPNSRPRYGVRSSGACCRWQSFPGLR